MRKAGRREGTERVGGGQNSFGRVTPKTHDDERMSRRDMEAPPMLGEREWDDFPDPLREKRAATAVFTVFRVFLPTRNRDRLPRTRAPWTTNQSFHDDRFADGAAK